MIAADTLLSSNALPVETGNLIRLTATNVGSVAATVGLRVYLELEDGQLATSYDELTVGTGGGSETIAVPVSSGRLISAACFAIVQTAQFGGLWATIELQQSELVDPTYRLPLASGYVTDYQWVQFPLGGVNSPATGQGGTEIPTIADPAAGQPLLWLPPQSSGQHILAFAFTFDTDANIAARRVHFQLWDGGSVFIDAPARTTQLAAGEKFYFIWCGPNLPTDVGDNIYIPYPLQTYVSRLRYRVLVDNIQAGDQISGISAAYNNLFSPRT